MCKKVVSVIAFLVVLFALGTSCNKGSPASPELPLPTKRQLWIYSFVVSPKVIKLGKSAYLSWKVEGAKTIWIEPGFGDVTDSGGSREVSPPETTTYTITAKNDDGQGSGTCKLVVDPSIMVMVEGPIFVDGDSTFQYKGTVKNIGTGRPPDMVSATITVRDSNNRELSSKWSFVWPRTMGPAEVARYTVEFSDGDHSIRNRMDKSKTTWTIELRGTPEIGPGR